MGISNDYTQSIDKRHIEELKEHLNGIEVRVN